MYSSADTGGNAHNLSAAYTRLSTNKRADGQGSIYVFCSAKSQCGTSYVARSMALIAEQNLMPGEQVLLVDMDIQNNAQSSYFFAPENQTYYGLPSGPYDASFDVQTFWKVTPAIVDNDGENKSDNHFMSLHKPEALSMMFTHFHWEHFLQGQNVHIQNSREYWHKLRQHFSVIIIDTPALDRADIIGTVCPEADACILVSTNQDARSQSLTDIATHVQSLGGTCAGVILNQPPIQTTNYGGAL